MEVRKGGEEAGGCRGVQGSPGGRVWILDG